MAKKLKIAVWYNLPSGGGKRALYYHLRGLVERGHHVETWSPPLARDGFADLRPLVQEHEVPLDFLQEGRNYVDKVSRHIRRPYLLMESMKSHSKECMRQIHDGSFDVLFSNTCMYFASPFIARYTQMPSVLYLGEPDRRLYEMPQFPWRALPEPVRNARSPSAWRRRVRDKIDIAAKRAQAREELANAKAHDRILVNSLFSRESVLRAYGLNSSVCYLGVDQQIFQHRKLPRENFLIGLGSISPTKNVRLAIQAVAAMEGPKPELVWVGNLKEDVYFAEMHDLATRLGVSFKPMLMASDEVLVDLLNRASAMIYTSRLEPFGLAPLEANACGCPVIAVAEGGVRETVVDRVNGLVVEPTGEPLTQSLAKAADWLLADRELREGLGQTGLKIVGDHWSLKCAVDRVEEALLKAAS